MNKYVIYPMKGADITIKADGYSICDNIIDFVEVYMDNNNPRKRTVAIFNYDNIIGLEEINES